MLYSAKLAALVMVSLHIIEQGSKLHSYEVLLSELAPFFSVQTSISTNIFSSSQMVCVLSVDRDHSNSNYVDNT